MSGNSAAVSAIITISTWRLVALRSPTKSLVGVMVTTSHRDPKPSRNLVKEALISSPVVGELNRNLASWVSFSIRFASRKSALAIFARVAIWSLPLITWTAISRLGAAIILASTVSAMTAMLLALARWLARKCDRPSIVILALAAPMNSPL